MKKAVCIVLALLLCIGPFPVSASAEEPVFNTVTVNVFSSECGFESIRVYLWEDRCFMDIKDIARYTRSAYSVEGNTLTITHGSRSMDVDLTTNTLSEDGITAEIYTRCSEDYIVVHAYPMLTYLGAECNTTGNMLTINMPECTVWEGLVRTENENYFTLETFGGENEQKVRLLLNGVLSILNGDLAGILCTTARTDAIILTAQIDGLKYLSDWDRKKAAEERQLDLLTQVVEDYDSSAETAQPVLDITLDAVEASLDHPTLFSAFKSSWDDGIDQLSYSFSVMKQISELKKTTSDSSEIFGVCLNYLSPDSRFAVNLGILEQAVISAGRQELYAAFSATMEEVAALGFEGALSLLADKASMALNVSVLLHNIVYGEESAFNYAAAETNAMYLLYLKDDVRNAIAASGQKILAENYSSKQHIDEYRLLNMFYYKILIAANEQLEEMIIAQGRQNDTDMVEVIDRLHSNSQEFAKNLYMLTMSTGSAFPNVEESSQNNGWDDKDCLEAVKAGTDKFIFSYIGEDISTVVSDLGTAYIDDYLAGGRCFTYEDLEVLFFFNQTADQSVFSIVAWGDINYGNGLTGKMTYPEIVAALSEYPDLNLKEPTEYYNMMDEMLQYSMEFMIGDDLFAFSWTSDPYENKSDRVTVNNFNVRFGME